MATVCVPRLRGSPTASVTARRPLCEVPGCRHRPPKSAERGDPAPPHGASPRMDQQTECSQQRQNQQTWNVVSAFSSVGRYVQGTLLTHPGWFLGEKLKCSFSNKINKPTHPWRQNFLHVPFNQGEPCWDLLMVKVTPGVTQDLHWTQNLLSQGKKKSPNTFNVVPKDCRKSQDGKWLFFSHNWWWLVNISLLPNLALAKTYCFE